MKEFVEKDIKKAFESWDHKKSDIGFNKELVWKSIANKKTEKKIVLTWSKIASITVIILLCSGLAYAIVNNQILKKEKIALTGNIHTLGEEIQQLKCQQQTEIKTILKTDTIIKIINTTTEKDHNSLNQLKNNNGNLINELNELKRLLQEQYNINQTLSDSIEFLAGNYTQSTDNQSKNSSKVADPSLKIKESEINDLSSTNFDKIETSNENRKSKLKFSIFNKQENTVYKAPNQQGIRF